MKERKKVQHIFIDELTSGKTFLILWEPTHGHRGRGRPKSTFMGVLKRDTSVDSSCKLATDGPSISLERSHFGSAVADVFVVRYSLLGAHH